MNTSTSVGLKVQKYVPAITSLLVMFTGALVFVGWITDTAALKSIMPILDCNILIWLTAIWLNRSDAVVREGERRYRELIESLPQLVWTSSADGLCDYLGPQWVAYTGIPEGGQLGYGWLEQNHPDDRERTVTSWKATAEIGSF